MLASPMLPFRLPKVPSPKIPNTQTSALPVIAGTDRAEPAIAARPGVGADDAGPAGDIQPPLADQMPPPPPPKM